jgi:hypothetical protein
MHVLSVILVACFPWPFDARPYQVSRWGGRVTVELRQRAAQDGAPANSVASPEGSRTLRGRVSARDGSSVAGAVVLVADRGWPSDGTRVDAEAATTAGADGTYVLPGVPGKQIYVAALHPLAGWSMPQRLEEGKVDETIDIRIPVPGRIVGRLRRAGVPVQGSISLEWSDTRLSMFRRADGQGSFEFALLPPGRYTLSASPVGFPGAESARLTAKTIVLGEGQTTLADFDLPVGLTIGVNVALGGRRASAITYFLARGALHGATAAELHRTIREAGERAFVTILLGGQDAPRVMTYRDVQPGEHTCCVAVEFRSDPRGAAETVACQEIRVEPSPARQEFSIRLPSP